MVQLAFPGQLLFVFGTAATEEMCSESDHCGLTESVFCSEAATPAQIQTLFLFHKPKSKSMILFMGDGSERFVSERINEGKCSRRNIEKTC